MYRPWAIPKVLDFMVKNRDKIPFDNIVSHTFKLADINEAFEKAEWLGREPEVTRACIVP
jgi:Zn-dependent alcohol dehydrogenase